MHRTSRCWQLCPHLTHLFSPHTAHDRSIIFRFSGFSFPPSPLLKHQPWRPRTAATETIFYYWFQSQPSATASSQHLLQQIQNEPITQECQWFAYRYTSRANVWFFGMSHSNQVLANFSLLPAQPSTPTWQSISLGWCVTHITPTRASVMFHPQSKLIKCLNDWVLYWILLL